jgi:L-aspartate oxidase
MQTFDFDIVVVGSGLAGLTAAYYSSQYGKVAIVTKSELDTSNSYYAQGGVAAAMDAGDSPEQHLQDTLTAGRGLCDYEAVKVLAYEGQERILDLMDMGMEFDREGSGYTLGLEGGHTRRRILHADGDATGKKLTSFMLEQVKKRKSIRFFEYTAVVDLVKQDNRVTGLQAFDFVKSENMLFRAGAVILATGGFSRIYARTTNPHTATGDGIALAWETGAKIADVEFVQFHPSALMIPGEDAFLISEAVRGEGAWLLNERGERFMKEIHPRAELAPRDVVAYAIYKQIQQSEGNRVFLSLKHLNPEALKERFHTIYTTLAGLGFDMINDPLPIAPAAHYMIGGIQTGLHGETHIPGLFVCGEAASTGVMGANRLASNSLTECLVFGKRASEMAAEQKPPREFPAEPQPIRIDPGNEKIFVETRNEIARLMMTNVGIVRNGEGLEQALERLTVLSEKYAEHGNEYNLWKIKNIITVGWLLTRGALIRKESRGSHIREDFNVQNADYRAHTIQQKGYSLHFEKVRD